MKKLFAFILSLQLVILPVGLATESGETNADYNKKSQMKDGGYDFYAKQILAISTSILGANIISQCSLGLKVPSVATFMAGSLVHIASEMMGAKAQNDNHNKRMKDLEIVKKKLVRTGGLVQKASLEQRLKEEEETRDFAKKRLMWTAATTVIYGIAAGLAISEEITGNTAGIAAATPECTAIAAACTVGSAGCMAACMATAPTGVIAANGAFAVPPIPGPAEAACNATGPVALPCILYLGTYLGIAYANCIPWTPAAGLLGDLMVAAVVGAYAQGVAGSAGTTSRYVILMTSVLGILVPSLQQMVMAAYNYPIPRAITFGASAALSGLVTVGLKQRKTQAENNIKKLEKVLSNFKLETNDPNGIELGNSANMNGSDSLAAGLDKNTGTKAYAIKRLADVKNAATIRNCLSVSAKSFEFSPSSCSNSVKIKRPNFDFKHGVKSLNELGVMANDLANAVSSGDSGKADLLAGQLANEAARVENINKNLQNKLNVKRKAEKKDELDLDKSISNKVASLGAAYNSAASSKGFTPSNFAASGGVASVSPNDEDTQKQPTNISVTVPNTVSPNMVFPSAGDLSGVDDGLGHESNASETNSKMASLSESLDQFETNDGDIAKDPEVSIFKQLSNRYILNYSKILNRKKATLEAEKEN